jgi:hypothetical protein
MGGLLQSVGNGIGGVVGGAANTIANMLGSIVNQTSQVVPGGFPGRGDRRDRRGRPGCDQPHPLSFRSRGE